jgi:hypothetical protein
MGNVQAAASQESKLGFDTLQHIIVRDMRFALNQHAKLSSTHDIWVCRSRAFKGAKRVSEAHGRLRLGKNSGNKDQVSHMSHTVMLVS